MAVELTREQRAAAENRGGDLLVSAAAGSGKTRVLVERLMGFVEAGEDIDGFLVITLLLIPFSDPTGPLSFP